MDQTKRNPSTIITIAPIRMNHLGVILTIFCLFTLEGIGGEEPQEELDLAPEALDDQYLGCRQAMKDQLKSQEILKHEMSGSKHFQRSWREAEKRWNLKKNELAPNLPEGFTDHHGIAIMVFTGSIRESFNRAVKSAGKSYKSYREEFNYKYLHYYLTVALQLLYKDCGGEHHVSYRGFPKDVHWMSTESGLVKFGHFLHTSSSEWIAHEMGNASFITVYGCSGVPVHNFSDYPEEEEVVFPGYEIFTATQVEEDPKEFSLVSTGKWCSNFNCALVQGEKSKVPVEDCINSADNSTWSDREAWLQNMPEEKMIGSAADNSTWSDREAWLQNMPEEKMIGSAAPPVFCSGTATLTALLAAAVVTFLL
ncbi:T-cell ecto-ADP-ribosyltransferase 1-like [Pyxicephalus adspersus]|uniref:T-cell ecto-ADP-ribosyltransferase 1-like n=1 Tax=Pyxicephalus adspersus TaxID=30357 RepID=UPI003B5AB8CC